MATPKKPRPPVPELSVTAMLMQASESVAAASPVGAVEYPFSSREILANPELLDHAPVREIALKIIAAYAAEHPLPTPTAEDIADTVDFKMALDGLRLAQARGISLEQARREVLPQARAEVAKELGNNTSTEAVKLAHLRVRRVKQRPR